MCSVVDKNLEHPLSTLLLLGVVVLEYVFLLDYVFFARVILDPK